MSSLVEKFYENALAGATRQVDIWTFLPSVDIVLRIFEVRTAIGDEIKARRQISLKLWEVFRAVQERADGEVLVATSSSFSSEVKHELTRHWGIRGVRNKEWIFLIARRELAAWLRKQGGVVTVQWGQVRLVGTQKPGNQIIVGPGAA